MTTRLMLKRFPETKLKLALAILLPFFTLAVQTLFWEAIRPYAWFLFFLTVFFSSWIGKRLGGVISTLLSVAIVKWFFMLPGHTFELENAMQGMNLFMFFIVGCLVSQTHHRFRVRAGELLSRQAELEHVLEKLTESELRFRTIYDSVKGAILMHDPKTGRILEVNAAACAMFGLSENELVGSDVSNISANTPPDTAEATKEKFELVMAGEDHGFEWLAKNSANENFWIAVHLQRININGQPRVMAVVQNIDQRKQAEQKLAMLARRAEALLELPEQSAVLEEAAFMAYVLDLAEELTGSEIGFMHFIDPDEETVELVAWSAKTLSKYCQAAFDQHYPISQAGIWANAVQQKRPVVINDYATAENKQGLPVGHSALVRLISVPVLEEGKVRMLTGVGNKSGIYTEIDVETVQLLGNEAWRIVRRQRAEKALKIANQVVNASPVVCFRWAAMAGWPVVFVSENVKQWGYTAAALQSGQQPFVELVHPDDLPRIIGEVASKAASGCNAYTQEYRIVTPENRLIWVVDRTIVQRDASGNVLFYDGVLTDITERKAQQLALSKTLSEQRELNRRLEEAHNQLLQSEKMASIGQLAAGIAHELNNPIGFVHSNLGTLDGYVRDLMEIIDAYDELATTEATASPLFGKVRQLREERDFNYIREDIGQLMHESKDGLSRVRKIVLDLKSFAHAGGQDWEWADLHQGLDSTLNIVWNEIKYKSKVVKEYGDLPKVNCMISQLNQVFMNLLVNASHAIEAQGTITLRTACLNDTEVCIEVSDTGKGIAPEHLTRVFEPFFTTKAVGKGTGLGLSLSYGIVQKHHGRIEVESTVGQGTTFRVIIPINQDAGVAGLSTEASV